MNESVAVGGGNLQLSDRLLHEVVVTCIEFELAMVAINVDLSRLSVETWDVLRIFFLGGKSSLFSR